MNDICIRTTSAFNDNWGNIAWQKIQTVIGNEVTTVAYLDAGTNVEVVVQADFVGLAEVIRSRYRVTSARRNGQLLHKRLIQQLSPWIDGGYVDPLSARNFFSYCLEPSGPKPPPDALPYLQSSYSYMPSTVAGLADSPILISVPAPHL